jgi:putative endonuclease
MAQHSDTGRFGEDIAEQYVKGHGHKIIERNYRTRYMELDLITKKKDMLIVVEVRTKIGEDRGSPEDTINRQKIGRLRRGAQVYAAMNNWSGRLRVDAACIVLKPDFSVERFDYYENI